MSAKNRTIHKTACVTPRSLLKGNFEITIGAGTVVHPECQIYARKGPIKIGSGCLLEEQCVILNDSTETMVIGDDNVFEVGSWVKSISIGKQNIFECKSSVALGAKIGNGCVVGTACAICKGDNLEDNTVVFGAKQQRRVVKNNRNLAQVKSALVALPKLLF